jgi:hypothetical protein
VNATALATHTNADRLSIPRQSVRPRSTIPTGAVRTPAREGERRYAVVGDYVAALTPANAVVICVSAP